MTGMTGNEEGWFFECLRLDAELTEKRLPPFVCQFILAHHIG